ncbi:MAG: UDP-N-acetylglucosamine 1-carboxyvinyltransferase [bacterium]|nr:UDP-N-acetylglucosamine 1-carboxyvinyltransferase [bacterium]
MKFKITGGKTLSGEIELAGAKNAATKLMITSLLTNEPCVLENMPHIGDVMITGELCKSVGSFISHEGHTLTIATPEITTHKVGPLSRKNRIPILALGPLLARTGKAEVPFLGGDKIGARPVDIHLAALQEMGAVIKVEGDTYVAEAPNGLRGARIDMRFPSVGATENTILAAVLAKGRTVIHNAAVEPEIIDVIKFLQKMGAIIELGTNRMIAIEGVSKLHGAKHEVMPDRNEAVSFACLGLVTGGPVLVKNARQDELITFLNAVRRIGGDYQVRSNGISFFRPEGVQFQGIEIETDTHPGFMTDWQQPFAVVLTQAEGLSVIHETVFEDRFGYIKDLGTMGADIKVLNKCLGELKCRFSGGNSAHCAVIDGPTKLKAANLMVKDLRSGMVNIIAALIADGVSIIDGIEEIDRGYENIDTRLRALGAQIERIG